MRQREGTLCSEEEEEQNFYLSHCGGVYRAFLDELDKFFLLVGLYLDLHQDTVTCCQSLSDIWQRSKVTEGQEGGRGAGLNAHKCFCQKRRAGVGDLGFETLWFFTCCTD